MLIAEAKVVTDRASRYLVQVCRHVNQAPDEQSLRQLEQRVADRLEQVGRRDRLTVTWTPPQASGEQPPSRPTGPTDDDERTRT